MQPLQANRRSSSQPASHPESQPLLNAQPSSHIRSSSSDDYLQTNLAKIIKKGRSQAHNQPCNNRQQQFHHENDQQKKERNVQKKLGEISFQDGAQEDRLYPRDDDEDKQYGARKRNRNASRLAHDSDDEQQEFFRMLDFKQQQPPNLYIYQRYVLQQQRLKKQKAQRLTNPRWKIVHPNSSTSKAQDSDSSNMSNPFDESIPQKVKKPKRHSRVSKVSNTSKVKQVIILDSSEESNAEKESGEISERLHNGPIKKIITSAVTQVTELVGEEQKGPIPNESKQKEQIQLQVRNLSEKNVKRESHQDYQEKQQIFLSKGDSVEY